MRQQRADRDAVESETKGVFLFGTMATSKKITTASNYRSVRNRKFRAPVCQLVLGEKPKETHISWILELRHGLTVEVRLLIIHCQSSVMLAKGSSASWASSGRVHTVLTHQYGTNTDHCDFRWTGTKTPPPRHAIEQIARRPLLNQEFWDYSLTAMQPKNFFMFHVRVQRGFVLVGGEVCQHINH